MLLLRLLRDAIGRVLISMLVGLGVASLFARVCRGTGCVIVRAPLRELVENQTFRIDDASTCVRYHRRERPCALLAAPENVPARHAGPRVPA